MISRKDIAANKVDTKRLKSIDENRHEIEIQGIPSDINLKRWPTQTYAILAVEACERFAFYGMKSVLGLYFRNYLGKREDEATSIYHTWSAFLYITPIMGAVIADSYWGRFKTIWRLSLVYLLGMILLTMSSIPTLISSDMSRDTHFYLTIAGLLCIGLGAGGIKPCVSPFGADQFHKNAVKAKESYFRWFYMLINIGACIGGALTPFLREKDWLYEQSQNGAQKIAQSIARSNATNAASGIATWSWAFDQSHALAFGVPTVLFVISLIFYFTPEIFTHFNSNLFGKYTKNEPDSSENMISKFYRVVIKKESRNQYEKAACIQVLALFVRIFLPLSFFWCLLDGVGTFWTYSACQGSGLVTIFGYQITFICDQLEVINPVMIIVLIPVYNVYLDPLIENLFYKDRSDGGASRKTGFWKKMTAKRDISKKPIDVMLVGMIICTFAAVLSWRFDVKLSDSLQTFDTNEINTKQIAVKLYSADLELINELERCDEFVIFDKGTQKTKFIDFYDRKLTYGDFSTGACHNEVDGIVDAEDTTSSKPHKLLARTNDGQIIVRHVANGLAKQFGIEIFDENNGFNKMFYDGNPKNAKNDIQKLIKKYPNNDKFWSDKTNKIVKDGARFIISKNGSVLELHEYRTVSVTGLIPQYFMLTLAEVFISVTALEFAYTQAPASMRTLTTAFWYATVAVGNMIVTLIAKCRVSRSDKQLYMVFCLAFGSVLYYFLSKGYRVLNIDDVVVKFEAPIDEEDEDDSDLPPLYDPVLSKRMNHDFELVVEPSNISNDNSQIELLKT